MIKPPTENKHQTLIRAHCLIFDDIELPLTASDQWKIIESILTVNEKNFFYAGGMYVPDHYVTVYVSNLQALLFTKSNVLGMHHIELAKNNNSDLWNVRMVRYQWFGEHMSIERRQQIVAR